jgi:hypothetical protein
LSAGAVVRYGLGKESSGGGLRPPRRDSRRGISPLDRFGPDAGELWRSAATANQFVRDESFLNWRYVDSPRDYRRFGAYRGAELRGFAVVGHAVKHGVSSGFLADLVAPDETDRVALLRRCLEELAPGTDALIALVAPGYRGAFLRAGFLPTYKRIRFIGKSLDGRAVPDVDWHFTLGDFDFF